MAARGETPVFMAMLRVVAAEVDRLIEALEAAPWPEAVGVTAFEDPGAKTWTVSGFYSFLPPTAALSDIAERAGVTLRMLSTEALPQTDWVKKSLADLAPIKAGRFFVSGAHDRDKAPAGAIALQIEAGQAFGTGSHPTTRGSLLMIEALAKARRFSRPLDLGTGSGILAFAMARVFAVAVIGIDIDEDAVTTARTNAAVNRLAGRVRLITGDGFRHRAITARAPYDLIVANILAGPLVDLARPLERHLAPTGRVVLSGLLAHQDAYVRAAYRAQGLFLKRRLVIDDWATLLLAR